MIRKFAVVSLTLATLATASLSAYAETEGMVDDATKAKIVEVLKAKGYEVGKIKTEDGMFEAYAKKDGKKLEVYLNDKLEIVKSKSGD